MARQITRDRGAAGGPIILAVAVAAAIAATVRLRSRRTTFADHVVLITGGSRGLGLAMARRFAAEHAHLVLLARSADELERAAADLRATAASVMAVTCDIRDEEAVAIAVREIASIHGRIDILVNNAGVIQVTPFVIGAGRPCARR